MTSHAYFTFIFSLLFSVWGASLGEGEILSVYLTSSSAHTNCKINIRRTRTETDRKKKKIPTGTKMGDKKKYRKRCRLSKTFVVPDLF